MQGRIQGGERGRDGSSLSSLSATHRTFSTGGAALVSCQHAKQTTMDPWTAYYHGPHSDHHQEGHLSQHRAHPAVWPARRAGPRPWCRPGHNWLPDTKTMIARVPANVRISRSMASGELGTVASIMTLRAAKSLSNCTISAATLPNEALATSMA